MFQSLNIYSLVEYIFISITNNKAVFELTFDERQYRRKMSTVELTFADLGDIIVKMKNTLKYSLLKMLYFHLFIEDPKGRVLRKFHHFII